MGIVSSNDSNSEQSKKKVVVSNINAYPASLQDVEVAHYMPHTFPLIPIISKKCCHYCRQSWQDIINADVVDESGVRTSGITVFYNEFYQRLGLLDTNGHFEDIFSNACGGKNKIAAKGGLLIRIVKYLIDIKSDSKEMQKKLIQLGKSHSKKGIRPWQYSLFIDTLLLTISSRLGVKATHLVMDSWVNLFAYVMKTMLRYAIKGQVDPNELHINACPSSSRRNRHSVASQVEAVIEHDLLPSISTHNFLRRVGSINNLLGGFRSKRGSTLSVADAENIQISSDGHNLSSAASPKHASKRTAASEVQSNRSVATAANISTTNINNNNSNRKTSTTDNDNNKNGVVNASGLANNNNNYNSSSQASITCPIKNDVKKKDKKSISPTRKQLPSQTSLSKVQCADVDSSREEVKQSNSNNTNSNSDANNDINNNIVKSSLNNNNNNSNKLFNNSRSKDRKNNNNNNNNNNNKSKNNNNNNNNKNDRSNNNNESKSANNEDQNNKNRNKVLPPIVGRNQDDNSTNTNAATNSGQQETSDTLLLTTAAISDIRSKRNKEYAVFIEKQRSISHLPSFDELSENVETDFSSDDERLGSSAHFNRRNTTGSGGKYAPDSNIQSQSDIPLTSSRTTSIYRTEGSPRLQEGQHHKRQQYNRLESAGNNEGVSPYVPPARNTLDLFHEDSIEIESESRSARNRFSNSHSSDSSEETAGPAGVSTTPVSQVVKRKGSVETATKKISV